MSDTPAPRGDEVGATEGSTPPFRVSSASAADDASGTGDLAEDAGLAAELVKALHEVAADLDVIIPLHPRGRATLTAAGLLDAQNIHVTDPLGYIEFMSLVRGAAAIVTDSGGVQEETTLLRVPCLTLRPNTERPITITSGSNRLVTRDELAAAVLKACDDGPYAGELPPLWDGQAGPRIARIVTSWLAQR